MMEGQGVYLPCGLSYPENYYDLAQTMRPGETQPHSQHQGHGAPEHLRVRQGCCSLCSSQRPCWGPGSWRIRKGGFGEGGGGGKRPCHRVGQSTLQLVTVLVSLVTSQPAWCSSPFWGLGRWQILERGGGVEDPVTRLASPQCSLSWSSSAW